MTKISVNVFKDTFNGKVPISYRVTARPVVRQIVDGSIITRNAKTYDGLLNSTFELTPTKLGEAWMISILASNDDEVTGYYKVPDVEEILFTELIEVDPETLEPDAEPEPEWWAVSKATIQGGVVDTDGDLILTRSDGVKINAGHVQGEPGVNGVSIQGSPGKPGAPGVGFADAELDVNGDLNLIKTTGDIINVGHVVGRDGIDGLNDAGVSNLIQTPASETASALSAAIVDEIVVNQRPMLIDVKGFGAKGNNVDDDTAAIQATIDYAETVGGTVFFPQGRYKVLGSLTPFSGMSLHSFDQNKSSVFGITQDYRCQIDTYAENVFVPRSGVTQYRTAITGLNIQSKRAGAETPATLFHSGIELYAAKIYNMNVFNYHKVFGGLLAGVSAVQASTFHGTKDACFAGGVVDSYISQNYIGGASGSGFNATGIVLNSASSHVTIHNNFIEFFKYGIRYDFAVPKANIHHNVFDYMYRGISTSEPSTGRGATITEANIDHNLFNRMSLRQFPGLSNFFPNPDSQMIADPVGVGINAKYGVNRSTFDTNTFAENDLGIRVREYPVYNFQERGSMYRGMPTIEERIDYLPAGMAEPLFSDVYIGTLDNRRVSALPIANISTTGGYVHSFDKQRLIYNNKPIFNDNGVWRDSMGALVT